MTCAWIIGGFLQGILHPAIRFAANMDEQITVRDLNDIICGGLIAVQIYAVVQKHGNLGMIGLVAEDFAHPVILRENSRDDFQRLPLCDADGAGADEDAAFPQPPKMPETSKRQKNTANIRFFIEMLSIV